MKSKREVAVEKFLENYNCAQSVLYSFCDDLRFDKNTALKMTCGLGAGMGRKQEVCGAVTGGIIVIGAKYGRGEGEDRRATELTYAKPENSWNALSGNTAPLFVGNCELTTEEGQKHFKDNDLAKKTCKQCVGTVVEILEDIMETGSRGIEVSP